jgi:hypothetical protein
MEQNTGSAVVARPKSAVFVTVNGTAKRIAPKMRKRINFSKRQSSRDGNDVIIAEPWLS